MVATALQPKTRTLHLRVYLLYSSSLHNHLYQSNTNDPNVHEMRENQNQPIIAPQTINDIFLVSTNGKNHRILITAPIIYTLFLQYLSARVHVGISKSIQTPVEISAITVLAVTDIHKYWV